MMLKIMQRAGVALGLLIISAAAPAAAAEGVFSGRVDHVSTDNLKITNDQGKTLSFVLVPHFDQVFQFDGKTTYQMKKIHPGMWVRVYYDQHFIGVRHADKIVLWRHHHYAGKTGS